MRLKLLILCAIGLVFLILPTGGDGYRSSNIALADSTSGFSVSYTSHSPITITSNADFSSQGWPGNGEEGNPYVIEGLSITDLSVCINISNTDAYFEIKDCYISASEQSYEPGISFDNVTHGSVDNCIIEIHQPGFYAIDSHLCNMTSNTIRDNRFNGIEIRSSTGFTLLNNTVINSSWDGFYLNSVSSSDLINNTADNNDDGFELRSSESCNLTDNIARNNEYNGYRSVSLSSCIVMNNTAYSNDWGFSFDSSDLCTITNNTARNNVWRGVDLDSSTSCVLSDNTITTNGFYGYYLQNSCFNITMTDNTVTDHWEQGFYIEDSSSCILINNTSTENDQDGFYLLNSNDCNLTDNFAMSNAGYGYWLENSHDCFLTNNTARDDRYAFYITQSSFNLIENTVTSNTYGFYITGSTANLENNTASDSAGFGFNIKSSTTLLKNNTACDNGGLGFNIENSDTSTLISNVAIGNGQQGFYLTGSQDCILANNTATSNIVQGFCIISSFNSTLVNNLAVNNSRGFFLSGSSNSTLANNSAIDNRDSGIYLHNSHYSNLTENTARNNTLTGFYLNGADYSTLINNTAEINDIFGINLDSSSRCILLDNTLITDGVYISGDLADFLHNMSENTVNGKPLGYFKNSTGIDVDGSEYGQVILANCSETSLSNGFFDDAVGLLVGYCTDCSLVNNTATNNPSDGFYLHYSTSCILTENKVENNSGHGFYLYRSHSCSLTWNEAMNNTGNGFYLYVSNSCNVTGNTAKNNTGYGFYLRGSSSCNLTSNIAFYNGDDGFYIRSPTLLSNNTAMSNDGYGFQISNSAFCTLTNNSAIDQVNSGFYLIGSSNCTLCNNLASNNSEYGFAILNSENCTLSGNDALGNLLDGFIFDGSPSCIISDNTATENTGHGIDIYSSPLCDLRGNNAWNNELCGFNITLSANCTLTDNNAIGNTHDGYYIYDSSYCILDNNTAWNNGRDGFALDDLSDCILIDNAALDCRHGFRIYNSPSCTLTNNTAENNRQDGFSFFNSYYCSLTLNTATDNTRDGFNFQQLANCTFTENTAIGCRNGFYIYFSPNCTMTGNTAIGHELGGFHIWGTFGSSTTTLMSNIAMNSTSGSGFYVHDLTYCSLMNNSATNCNYYGFQLVLSSYCDFSNNTAIGNLYGGFALSSTSNSTLANNIAYNNGNGFWIRTSELCDFMNNTAENNERGFYLESSGNCTLTDNLVKNCSQDGFHYFSSSDCNLTYNTIIGNLYGIRLQNCSENNIWNNTLVNNGLVISGSSIYHWFHNISDNTVNDKPLGYFESIYDTIIDGISYGQIILANCSETTVMDGVFINASVGILLGYSSYCTIKNNTVSENVYGIFVGNFSTDNLFYLNLLFFNMESNAFDNGSSNSWDNDTHGNRWGDYSGTGTYPIPGDAGSVDNYPILFDYIPPIINSPLDVQYDELSTGHSIEWSPDDLHPDSYTIYLDGALLQSGSWNSSSETINITIDGHDLGSYNYTIVVTDVGRNNSSDTVIVTVVDGTLPTIDSPEDIEYESGSTGHSIEWSPDDLHPDSYTIYLDGDPVRSGAWNSTSETIIIFVDGLDLGVYVYEITVWDVAYNSVTDIVVVTVVDTTTPTIDSPEDTEYECGSTGHSITWTPDDLNPSSYEIYFEESIFRTGTWNSSSETIIMSVDGLAIGIYNCTVVISDLGGNTDSDTVIVTVVDTTKPTIDSPEDIEYECGNTGHSITWTPDDLNPDTYEILLDGASVKSGSWNATSETITISIDGLELGIYNYTIIVEDEGANTVNDTVIVTVVDTTSPDIDNPNDIEYECGSTGNSIEWSPDDLHPDSYTIYCNDNSVKSGTWNSTSETITISVDGHGLGTHNYTVVVFDLKGNDVTDTVIVVVVDTTRPTIDSPEDIEYVFGSTGHTIEWSPEDLNPDTYEIFLDGASVKSGSWNATSENITISVDGLDVGSYIYMIMVNDRGGNSIVDTVSVTVTEETTTTETTTDTTTETTTDITTVTDLPTPPIVIILLVIGAAISGVVIVVLFVYIRKRK